jgi:uncharacterized protein (DUF952 family)
MAPADVVVFKALRSHEWDALQRDGRTTGSPDDQRDGFIHLSLAEQLEGTLARHFSRPQDREVVLLALSVGALGDALKWEPSRGGDLFPHLYSALTLDQVRRRYALMRAPDGHYVLPPELMA